MRTRLVCTLSLPIVLYDTVKALAADAAARPDLLAELIPAAPPVGPPTLDKLGLLPADYDALRSLAPDHGGRKGEDLVSVAMLHPAVGAAAARLVRRAVTQNNKVRRTKKPVINVSRLVEALLLKGLGSLNATAKPGASSRRHAGKTVKEPARS